MTGRPEVVVITGASAGVGRATAHRFARDGARVALLARDRNGLEAAAREVREGGGEALVCPVDVADAEQVEAAAARVEAEWGTIDTWVNNAMATVFAPAWEVSAEEFRRATEVTYLGTVHGTLAALRRMRARNRGSVVQVGSALAYRAIPLQSAYCAAKFAIRGFTDALRTELMHEHSRVRVTMVQLPAFNTPQFQWARTHMSGRPKPVPPIYQPEVAAQAIHWAAHHRRRELWVGWSAVKAILGNRLCPRYADRLLARTGWNSQLDHEPLPAERPDNLFEPAGIDYGTHGRFDRRARGFSSQLWLSTHPAVPALAAAALGWLLAGRAAHRRPRRQ